MRDVPVTDQQQQQNVPRASSGCASLMTETTRQLVDLEGYRVINKNRYERVLWERRFMACAIGLTLLSIIFFVISVATASWAIIDILPRVNHTIRFHLGIWGEYRTDINQSQTTSIWIRHFPDPPPNLKRLMDHDLPHYYRTQAVFSVISVTLMLIAIWFALYSFKHHRYMYKRLTAGLLALAAMCILVVIEVLVHSINEWKVLTDDDTHMKHEDYLGGLTYGYSIYLAWIVFAIYALGALTFIFGGKKQKGSRAATQEFEVEDRPVNLGR